MEYIGLFFIGLVAVTIGTLAGGGGLISLPAMLLIGIPVHAAVGASKISNTVSSLSTFMTVLLKKKISFKELYWIVPVSLSGGLSGGFIANRLSDNTMLAIATVLLVVAFVFSFLSKGDFSGDAPLKPDKFTMPSLFGIGVYDGLFGPGQATILLQIFGHLNISYIRAIGFVRVATFSSAFGAAIGYITSGNIIWPVAISLMLGSLAGARVGVHIAEKLDPRFVKPILRAVTLLLIVEIIVQNFL
ncbi:sulfite exporter TauE/SafE family protein [Bhargavaea cecembensis]|uniref:sulfite exporter TauE/SafE family protein n=1 Tax=Bhargavaea cecembensis TaxID=394098 RepID=UPI00058BDCB9|nr:sulfite exporter TauE/SafE family protein [Bhargavaea cecembensis]